MERFNFGLSVSTDRETGETLAVYFRIRNGQVAETKEFADGSAFADYDRQGRLLGIELLGPCEITVLDRIARKEPKAKKFIRNAIPRHMAIA